LIFVFLPFWTEQRVHAVATALPTRASTSRGVCDAGRSGAFVFVGNGQFVTAIADAESGEQGGEGGNMWCAVASYGRVSADVNRLHHAN
jgi:hypothetical protein